MPTTEPISLSRDCEVIEIPSGESARLAKGTRVRVMQSQGGSFTLADERGGMHRLDERDADAIGQTVKTPESDAPQGSLQEKMIWDELKTIFDPEIPVNIVDLGLIYTAAVDPLENGKKIRIQMSLTAPGCGMANVLKADVETKLARLPEVKEVSVEVVFDPPWDPGRMSEAAKLALGFDADYGSQTSGGSFPIFR
ncbi:MAG TPA: putative Fe-S cluster assembly protein SufT [Terracidiphilus sp.]|nr:putative Fe-S cluster assembly protein SufT [Terracidiphilus sp.]